MDSQKDMTDLFLPWIELKEEKELIILSALGGNPETDKISGGRINLLFVTEPDLFVEQLVDGVKNWAKNVSYAYFNYCPVDFYIPNYDQIPKPALRGQDVVHLVMNRMMKCREQDSKAFKYLTCFNENQPKDFEDKIRRLRCLRPILKTEEKDLIVYYFRELRKQCQAMLNNPMPPNPKTVITLKNMAEARAKLFEREFVEEEDVEKAARILTETYKKLGCEEPHHEVDYWNEEQRDKKQRENLNELFKVMKIAAKDGHITRDKVIRLGRKIKLTEYESTECMKLLQETGYIAPEKNDKVRVL